MIGDLTSWPIIAWVGRCLHYFAHTAVTTIQRCQYLLQRREWEALSFLILPLVSNKTFDGEDDPRPDRLPRLYVSWEVPAGFHSRVQQEEFRVVGAFSEYLFCLRFSQTWKAQFSILGFVHQSSVALNIASKEPDVRASSFCVWVGLLPRRCQTCLRPLKGASPFCCPT